ncbi:hypothetical protein APUTEX25_000349 [Auxenochlorella protothecoides]|uniref:Aminopeptidase N n=1 Tax=Auxenochlorella protothecoides TaxID=3075 RepID=A0A3M7KZV5_AUXPR|nr:hypothetical protein APUTEX25_000349 [Auxenochlorella protothecoides]|eukprot:RMZ54832.1 hypothetical protein APUTEX25_000349 [Auxenochlorella protothecoides]
MAATDKPVEKFRKDYKPSPYLISTVHLDFQLNEESTLVQSKLRIVPNHAESSPVSLFLNGHADVVLESIRVNGADLEASHYAADAQGLTIKSGLPSGEWDLEIATRIKPQENTSLEGLYRSGGMFCSQCEAEGFRHITYFLDRPDVMAKYTSRIEADKAKYPVLLSNGNLVDQGDLEGGRHFTVWEDPFVKPCYLFALVAGDLAVQEDTFRTMSGKDVALRIYTDAHNTSKVAFAMQSLKRAMKWDEETFGLEYDLDLFNIVAVDDFNMGAMENKSLNLFNSRLVLATPDTATDADFGRIEGVVGHEYFHNWTGNRVTCRDWFQLTLKEGLTVYRDQEFSADLNSRGVRRVEDVARLRAAQFPEDAGPLAHAIRPDSVIKMDNFYTATVYEKGAEVVRLYEALLGRAGFRAGLDLYFARHDGGAVTCDDFRAAMADASGADLGGLEGWYARAGTPRVEVGVEHDAGAGTLTVTATQAPPVLTARGGGGDDGRAGDAQAGEQGDSPPPLLIPIRLGLLGADGAQQPLHLRSGPGPDPAGGSEAVLRLEHQRQTWAAALAALDRIGGKVRQEALDAFYAKWKHEPLVLLKWIAMQAASNLPGNTAAVRTLMQHEAVKLSNPNTCYSLFLAFARSPVNFHAADGSGYEFMADSVLQIDQINHQVAARMVGVFNSWRNYDAERGALMTAALRRMASANGISANVYEIVTKALP